MNGRIHVCEKCNGFLELSYSGWSCCSCRRKYLIQGNRVSEMWWKNQTLIDQEAEAVAARLYDGLFILETQTRETTPGYSTLQTSG